MLPFISDQYRTPTEYLDLDKITKTLQEKGATILVITKGRTRASLLDDLGCHRSDILDRLSNADRAKILCDHQHLFERLLPPRITYDKGIISIQHPQGEKIYYPMSKIDYIKSLVPRLNQPIQEINFLIMLYMSIVQHNHKSPHLHPSNNIMLHGNKI